MIRVLRLHTRRHICFASTRHTYPFSITYVSYTLAHYDIFRAWASFHNVLDHQRYFRAWSGIWGITGRHTFYMRHGETRDFDTFTVQIAFFALLLDKLIAYVA